MDRQILKPRILDALPIVLIIAIALSPLIDGDGETRGFSIITPQGSLNFSVEIDTTITLSSAVGPMTISIENGSARVINASCPHKICVKTGTISRPGNSIICAPGRVAIIVEGYKEFDAVTR